MNEQRRHPQHDQVARAVRDWFRQPFQGMGYRRDLAVRPASRGQGIGRTVFS